MSEALAPLKVLFVGLGSIGQRHLGNLRSLLGDRLHALAYRVRGREELLPSLVGAKAGQRIGDVLDVPVCQSLAQALEERPDVVFVCNPTSLHLPVAREAALAGCNLFIEKPLSHDWQGVEELIDLVEKRELVTYVGYQLRFHPCLQTLHSLVRERAIGQPLAVRAEVGEYLPSWHPYEDYRQSYAARRELGGGVILSLIHEIDYLYWLFGVPRLVFALGGHLSRLEMDVEDVASILLECSVDGRPLPVHLHMDYVQSPPSRTCTVLGEEGKIVVDFHALTVQVTRSDGKLSSSWSFTGYERNEMFLAQARHVLACLAHQARPLVTLPDGAQSLRIALAAKQSIATRQPVLLSVP
jgi:predicted dehydrogenase